MILRGLRGAHALITVTSAVHTDIAKTSQGLDKLRCTATAILSYRVKLSLSKTFSSSLKGKLNKKFPENLDPNFRSSLSY